MKHVLDDKNEIILAYEMNDEEIPMLHGYPVRLLVPGFIGVRSVKWVDKLIISDIEA
jgi:nitrate reductase (NAD(P)H)